MWYNRTTGFWGYMFRLSLVGLVSFLLSGCFFTGVNPKYKGPDTRPLELDQYYSRGESYSSAKEEIVQKTGDYQLKRITLESQAGTITIDYFERYEKSGELILVFPLLGGRNTISDYFADYFAQGGFDCAIIHRINDFKSPENFDRLEELLRKGVIRDRIALDYFENVYAKKDFGTFGISRGGINVAISAGVDERLKYNVIAMGGADLPNLFRASGQPRLRKYVRTVTDTRNISVDEFYTLLNERIKTDPKYLSKYMDARNALMFVSILDRSVPLKYGLKLRDSIGDPKTYYLFADHYAGILYTRYVQLIPPVGPLGIFPMDFIETTALNFYKQSFKRGRRDIREGLLQILQLPLNIIAAISEKLF